VVPPSSVTAPLAKLIITSGNFHAAEVGIAYAPVTTLSAIGGKPPYKWTANSGTLPTGLALSSDGKITGTPSVAGTFSFTVKVVDSAGGAVTRSVGVTVYAALAVTQSCIAKCSIGAGCTRCGGFGTASQGRPPYSYKVVRGGAPRGMTLSALTLKGGFPLGTYSLSVLVTDQFGAKATVGANWSIYGAAKLAAGSSCSNFGNPPQCSTTGWSYSGGNPSTAPSAVILGYKQYCVTFCSPTPTAPPPGWTVSLKGGSIVISAGGISCNAPSYVGYVTVALVDTTKCATTSRSNPADLLVDISNNC
jgi:Putative Ig domain